jgi:hypothetical protein
VRRAQSGEDSNAEDQQVLAQLRQLVSNGSGIPARSQPSNRTENEGEYDSNDQSDDEQPETSPYGFGMRPNVPPRSSDSLAVDDAENPLQLLARASYLQPSPDSRQGKSPQTVRRASMSTKGECSPDDLYAFFAPARVHLDIGDDIDPVSLGRVSEEEATTLFTLWVLLNTEKHIRN